MIKEVKKLQVIYNNNLVGILSEIDGGRIAFQYDGAWLKKGFSLSPLSLPLSPNIYISEKPFFQGLYGVFNDSLPDGWGELLMSRMLAKQGIDYSNISPLTKLTIINTNGLGGLTYEPSQTDDEPINYELDIIAKQASEILTDSENSTDLDKIYRLGGSSGGARPKAHITDGQDEWIVKFPCRIDPQDIGVAEFNTNSLAQKCGINVNEYKLFPSLLCSGYFGAKRFDRINGNRIHTVSLSALLETSHRIPNLDYMHLFQVTSTISARKETDLYEVYRRMCFNVLHANKDDHGKNFAFIYDEKNKGYILSPAYDLTKTPYKAEHEMAVLGNGNPTEKDLLAIAKEVKLSKSKCFKILEHIKIELNV